MGSKQSGIEALLKKGRRCKFPAEIKPMLATLVDAPVEEEGWLYEIKWDGYRALGFINNGTVEIKSRNNKSFKEKFYPVYDALKKWKINAIVDGEIVVVNEKGIPDFSDLQSWRSEADGHLNFYLFDILWVDGVDVMNLPLTERKEILRFVVPPDEIIKLSENFDATGKEFFELADKMGLEGIMAKKAAGKYIPDLRTKEWLKIKTEKRQEAIICGYTKNENTSKQFSALLLGLYENGGLEFIGPVGTGFTNQLQKELLQKLKPLITPKCPFREVPDYNKPSRFRPNPPKAEVTWVKPKLVCEISYRELTKDGAIRHPSFKGLREDNNANEVVREKPIHTDDIIEQTDKLSNKKMISSPGNKERKTFLNPKDEMQTRNIGGHDLKFTNLSKIYWPKENISKRDMLNYYYQAAPYMVPYYKDRPQTLNRYPHGINGETFYQKDVKGKVPGWIKTFPYHSYTDHRDKEFLVITNEASLLYVAAMGCIEINPWSSRIQSPDNPDWCIIDLDPDKNTFNQVIEAACVTKKILKYTSIERKIADRKGKMSTVAGPYSLRPKPGAPVSMPLHWEEVTKAIKITDYNIFNAIDRLKNEGDLFKGVLGKGIDLKKALKKIESIAK